MADPDLPALPAIPRLTYGITPPKRTFTAERRQKTAAAQIARIRELPVDALVLYDLQDESDRVEDDRPFPFIETIDPLEYAFEDLAELELPKVVYRAVTPHRPEDMRAWLSSLERRGGHTVLVGAPTRDREVALSLSDAYRLRREAAPHLSMGGVLIAERHEQKGNEHERVLRKIDHGCRFFISQAVFSTTATRNLLSDLHYRCAQAGREVPPVLLTLSPCGSAKTLAFMRWLGISVPRWIENEIVHAHDPLQTSIELAVEGFEDLRNFARDKGIELGCNVESVSLRRSEIDASVEMVRRVAVKLGL